ncbi:MAG: ArnT family glycosyltransferase [Planctomycetaceae bacterium]
MPIDQPPAPPTRSLTGVFLVWFVAIICLKWSALSEPPVWDAALGLFPAAAELANNGFNLPNLLQQPTYLNGGPNCHAESLVTWITAAVLWGVGQGPTAFTLLHVLHFAAAAWTLTVLHRLTAKSLGDSLAWLLCGTLLLCPVFRVQVGAMYLEIPLAACVVSAIASYADGKLGRALIWSTLAVMIKQTGLIVAGTLAVAVLVRPGSLAKRIGMALSFAGLGLVVAIGPMLFTPVLAGAAAATPPSSWWEFMRANHIPYLVSIPDVTIGCLLFVAIGVIRLREVWRSLTNETASDGQTPPDQLSGESNSLRSLPSSAVGAAFLVTVMFGLFFFVAPYFARLDFFCLPRYLVAILPCVFFGGAYWITTLNSPRLTAIGLVAVAMLFIGNRNGVWYPADHSNNLAVQERSESYHWIVAAQQEAIRTASNLPDNAVIYYGLPEHYFLKYPWMGYAVRKHPGGRCVFLPEECPKSPQKADLPEHFFVILDAPFLGDHELQSILHYATKDPTRQVRLLRKVQHGPYSVSLLEVQPKPPSRVVPAAFESTDE